MTVNLGMPAPPIPTLAPRRKTRQIRVGDVLVGGDAPISVQSMTTTKTHDIGATLQQIAALTAAGCDIVRVACPTDKDAEALPIIARQSQIPVIADIHFQPKYVFAAIEAGCGAVRVNPGNIRKFDDQIEAICASAAEHRVSLRIGVNAGSLDPRLLAKHGAPTAEALVESALWEASLFEQVGFYDFKISVKHHDPVVMIKAYEQLSEQCDYPLHLGVTEAGPAFQGTIKSAVAFGHLLSEGIGDTIRVSLSADPVEEVKVGHQDPGVAEPAPARPGDRLLSPPAVAARSTSSPSPTRSPTPSKGWRRRCGWPSWAASSTGWERAARPTSGWPPATGRARSSCTAR
jgi:(E)-4-hydroxy-3-methylbut-2-enyl-diphosphate synthase